jgi:hypothetical protein
MTLSTQIPDAGTPIFDAKGYINPVWHNFFNTMLRRTGGTRGGDQVVGDEILEATFAAGVPPMPEAQQPLMLDQLLASPRLVGESFGDVQQVASHGLQNDPDLHDVATTTAAGFMSAADKSKLNGISSGAAVSTVTGTAPIVSSGGAAPAISIVAATSSVPGSMSAADKAKLDLLTYAAGVWSPTFNFATNGDLAATWSISTGFYTKIGRMVFAQFVLVSSSFTWSTASGQLTIGGFPFPMAGPNICVGVLDWAGITKAGFTEFSVTMNTGSAAQIIANGSGQLRANIVAADMPSGGFVRLIGNISYPT